MGKAARVRFEKNGNEVQNAEASSSQQVETKGTTLDTILGVMETMSVQLNEISSTMKGTMSNGKKVETPGQPTTAVPDAAVDYQDILGKFLNLKQTATVQTYHEKFEEMRDLLMALKFGFPEGFLISTFLSGLKPEIKRSMGDYKPETLYHAFNLARIKEIENDLIIEDNLQRLDQARGAKLPSKHVEIFASPDNFLKFEAFVGGKAISVLISTVVPYSFIDTSLVKHVGSKLVEAEPLRVVFCLLGHEAASRFRFPKLQWTVQGHEFGADARVVDIKAYDMILGTDWVSSVGCLAISNGGIVVRRDGKEVVLKTERQ